MLKRILKGFILKVLLTDEFRTEVINKLNKKVNLPMLNEAQEKVLFQEIYAASEEAIVDYMNK